MSPNGNSITYRAKSGAMSASEATTFSPALPSMRDRARWPRLKRLSSCVWACVIFLRPLFVSGIARKLGIKDEQAFLEFGKLRAYLFPVDFQNLPPACAGSVAFIPKRRVTQHVPDRHSRGLSRPRNAIHVRIDASKSRWPERSRSAYGSSPMRS